MEIVRNSGDIILLNQDDIPCCIHHGHSSGSTWDGLGKPRDRARYAKKLGMTHLSLTDHGNMYMAMEHYFYCKEEGILPIIGIEAYHQAEFDNSKESKYHHLTLLAKTFKGYQNLCKLVTRSNVETFYKRPIMTFEQLAEHNEGIICLSGCVLGLLNQTILRGDFELAETYTEIFLQIYGDRFFFEVQPQEFEAQRVANLGILELAKIYNRPVVMTSDSHFIAPEDLDTYVLFRKMNYHPPKPKKIKKEKPLTKKQKAEQELKLLETVEEESCIPQEEVKIVEDSEVQTDDMFKIDQSPEEWEKGIRQQYGKLYIPSGRELADRWKAFMGTDGSDYVRQSQIIAESCEQYEIRFPEIVPEAIVEYDKNGKKVPAINILARKTREGLQRLKVWDKTATRKLDDGTVEIYRPYYERVKEELEVIVKKKYENYFLLVADMVETARKLGVAVGPGRGSGGGSMVAAALRITEIDPVEHYCMFRRFIHEERDSLPDFDTDYGPKIKRKEVVDYMKRKYDGKVATICNVSRLTKDQLLNDLAKVMNIPDVVRDTIKVATGRKGIGGKDKSILPVYEDLLKLPSLKKIDEDYNNVIKHFCNMYGNVRQMSVHASGIAISYDQLSECVPLFTRGPDRELYTSYSKEWIEKLGIVKVDALGVDEVGALQRMCQITGIDYHDIPMDDKKTYDNFCNLNTMGIFQINESAGAVAYVRAIRPRNIEEVCACISMNRPGSSNLKTEDVKQLDIYVSGKKGKMIASGVFAEYCEETYGALVYQEQIMQICRGIAGMSWKSASKVMKGLHGQTKRDDPMAQEFILGAKKKSGMDEEEAWKLFYTFTGYTFNKAHGLAYAYLSYWMMWFKTHYPFEFFLSALQYAAKDYEIGSYVRDALNNGVVTMLPHVNLSDINYSPQTFAKKRVIQSGLASIKGVGPAAYKPIISERKRNGEFKDEADLLSRVNGVDEKGNIKKSPIKSDTLQALRDIGALEFDFEKYREKCSKYLTNVRYGKVEKENEEAAN